MQLLPGSQHLLGPSKSGKLLNPKTCRIWGNVATGCLKKKGDLHMMLASIVGPVGANMCTEWTQQTLPVVPRHTLGSYFMFFVYLQCTL